MMAFTKKIKYACIGYEILKKNDKTGAIDKTFKIKQFVQDHCAPPGCCAHHPKT